MNPIQVERCYLSERHRLIICVILLSHLVYNFVSVVSVILYFVLLSLQTNNLPYFWLTLQFQFILEFDSSLHQNGRSWLYHCGQMHTRRALLAFKMKCECLS
jgi:hypothetical protein